MVIESVCGLNVLPAHDNKRDAVGQGIIFVLVLLKVEPTFIKERFIDMNHVYGWTVQDYYRFQWLWCDSHGNLKNVTISSKT